MAGNGNPYEQPPHQPYVAIPPPPPPPPLHHNPFPQPLYYHNNPIPLPPPRQPPPYNNPFPPPPPPPPPLLTNIIPIQPPPQPPPFNNPFPNPPPSPPPLQYQDPFPVPPPEVYYNMNPLPPPGLHQNPIPFAPVVYYNIPPMSESDDISIRLSEILSANHRKYEVNFKRVEIPVVVTSSSKVSERWLEKTRIKMKHNLRHNQERNIVGFGVECSGVEPGSASVLQICVVRRCLIFQIHRANKFPDKLRKFLNSVKLVGIKNGYDGQRLWWSRHGIRLKGGLLDLSYVAKSKYGWPLVNVSYEELVDEFLRVEGVRLDAYDITTWDWSAPQLSNDQVLHAAVDAYVSLQIGFELEAWKLWRPPRMHAS